MAVVPFSVSLLAKNVGEFDGYIGILIDLSKDRFEFMLGAWGNSRLRVFGPDPRYNFTREFPGARDKVYNLQVVVEEKRLLFMLDGETLHTVPKTSSARQAALSVCSIVGRAIAFTDFRIVEYR